MPLVQVKKHQAKSSSPHSPSLLTSDLSRHEFFASVFSMEIETWGTDQIKDQHNTENLHRMNDIYYEWQVTFILGSEKAHTSH
jgi:hypothetical protein